ncbi:hypothetical protein [Nostoc sp.]|uniref:hypothetical protein n=1 Tax=Nostoc sp. TaxID=1180 RepID=UPI002FFADE17
MAFVSTASAALYNVVISGNVIGYPFQRTGQLFTANTVTNVTQNDINPIEVAISSGNPFSAPDTGAIWFATNNTFLDSSSTLDLAYVNFSTDNVNTSITTIYPDQRIAATGSNIFTAITGITATPYTIYGGEIQLQFYNNFNNVSGTINVVGKGVAFGNMYQANISGYRIE